MRPYINDRVWVLYNLFLNCQSTTLYDKLKEHTFLKVVGYRDSYDSTNLLRARLDSGGTTVVQFVSTNNEGSLEKILLKQIVFILQHKLEGSRLAIFGWSNSSAQARKLVSDLKEPPQQVLSLRQTFDCSKIYEFLYNLNANLCLGVELAIQSGALSVGMVRNIDQYIDLLLLNDYSSNSTSGAFSMRTHDAKQNTGSLKVNRPSFDVSDIQDSGGSLQAVTKGGLVLVFAFEDEARMRDFENRFSVKLTRGPSVHPDGSFDVSQSETTNLSFRTYPENILTEKWLLRSETKWEWHQLSELFELPGVKFIRKIVNEYTIEFEGTLYAKAVVKSNPHYGALMSKLEKQPEDNNVLRTPTRPKEVSIKSDAMSLRLRQETQFTASLKTNVKPSFSLSDLKKSSGSLEGVASGDCFFFVFAFENAMKLEQFEREFSVKLTRGPSVHPDGSFDISQSETMSLSFRTYKQELLTERWSLVSKSKWEWEDLVELFELPGVKFIRKIVNERTIKFEGTLYARAVVKSNPRYSTMLVKD